jgi:hypothetical protein
MSSSGVHPALLDSLVVVVIAVLTLVVLDLVFLGCNGFGQLDRIIIRVGGTIFANAAKSRE